MAQTPTDANVYFVPAQSKWPFVGSIAMMVTMVGVASWLNDASWGRWTFYIG
ncbi:MAG: cytochrome c oxidase subunit 3, partial [Stenotrophomonas sp.]|nr:cytochrome c oxidase subunit 3 [Stenotrophomonas sp.]